MPRSGFVMHTAKKDSFTGDGLQTQVWTSSNSCNNSWYSNLIPLLFSLQRFHPSHDSIKRNSEFMTIMQ